MKVRLTRDIIVDGGAHAKAGTIHDMDDGTAKYLIGTNAVVAHRDSSPSRAVPALPPARPVTSEGDEDSGKKGNK